MFVLKSGEICPYKDKCKHNEFNQCFGANSNRRNPFTCIFYDKGVIDENQFRNPLDKTGKMKIIME